MFHFLLVSMDTRLPVFIIVLHINYRETLEAIARCLTFHMSPRLANNKLVGTKMQTDSTSRVAINGAFLRQPSISNAEHNLGIKMREASSGGVLSTRRVFKTVTLHDAIIFYASLCVCSPF